jgi:hypothetical protein
MSKREEIHAAILLGICASAAFAQLPPDQRADMVMQQMTLDEKFWWSTEQAVSKPPDRAPTAGRA